jgi:Protein of unknown function (DUF3047)
MISALNRVVCLTVVFMLGACAALPTSKPTSNALDWHAVKLPGKAETIYTEVNKEGRTAWHAVSEQSASMWRKHVQVLPAALKDISFSWWVQTKPTQASVADVAGEDSAARVLLAFAGDTSQLPMRTRAMFELAEALTGEKPPYATLMYVWDAKAPVGSVIINPRTDRVRKIVVDSGPMNLRQWRDHRRDVVADFKLAFGEAPGTLTSIALMTDSDNTASQATAWFGPITLH